VVCGAAYESCTAVARPARPILGHVYIAAARRENREEKNKHGNCKKIVPQFSNRSIELRMRRLKAVVEWMMK
jgi:hypothetical protein